MVEASTISALESAAADLADLLQGWTHARRQESEASQLDLATINEGIQSLWRLVSVQKSIEQLKHPQPARTSPDGQRSEFRFGVQASACPANAAPQSPSAEPPQANPSQFQSSPFTLHSSVPSVPTVPTLHSLESIVARTEKLYAQTTALISSTDQPIPGNADLPIGIIPPNQVLPPVSSESVPNIPDQLKPNIIDFLISRPIYPGADNPLGALRHELITSPP